MDLLLGFVLIVSSAPSFHNVLVFASTSPEFVQNKLSQVQRIYIGGMGQADEAARFRLLLEDRLTEKGFTVVDKPEDADAILKGALSVRVDDGSEARVYVTLETLKGDRLWTRDFGNGIFKSLFTLKEPVKLRAQEVADALRDACKRSAKR
jgi:hypothetical protein